VSQPRDYWSTKPSIPVGTRILRIVCDFIDTQMSRVVPKANAGIELSANYTYNKKFFSLAKRKTQDFMDLAFFLALFSVHDVLTCTCVLQLEFCNLLITEKRRKNDVDLNVFTISIF